MTIRAKFTGDGSSYLMGIPARDLEQEEYDALNEAEQARLAESGLYEMVGEAPVAEAAPAAEEPVPAPPEEGGQTNG